MKKTKKGFTLVELVIVVAVMAVLVAVAIPTVGAITQSAKDSVNNTNARTIESMIKLEAAELAKESDGTHKMTEQNVADAIAKAQLGITSTNFKYNTQTGSCEYTTATSTSTAGEYIIKIGTTDVTVVSSTDGTGKTANLAYTS